MAQAGDEISVGSSLLQVLIVLVPIWIGGVRYYIAQNTEARTDHTNDVMEYAKKNPLASPEEIGKAISGEAEGIAPPSPEDFYSTSLAYVLPLSGLLLHVITTFTILALFQHTGALLSTALFFLQYGLWKLIGEGISAVNQSETGLYGSHTVHPISEQARFSVTAITAVASLYMIGSALWPIQWLWVPLAKNI